MLSASAFTTSGDHAHVLDEQMRIIARDVEYSFLDKHHIPLAQEVFANRVDFGDVVFLGAEESDEGQHS